MSERKQQRLGYTEIAPDGIAPMRPLEHYLNAMSGIEAVLLELVRLRVSQINGCAFCMGLHAHELLRHNEPEERIAGVAGWQASEAYTQRERAALAWAEVLTAAQGEVAEEQFAAVRAHFDEKQLVDLTLAIGSINAWNRLGIAFLPQWDEAKASRERRAAEPAGAGDVQAAATAEEPSGDEGKVSVEEESS